MNVKYTYSVTDSKVYCMAYYAGKTVKGVSKCYPDDTFDLDTGKNLAKARCDFKLSKKRLKRALARLNEAVDRQKEAERALARCHKSVEELWAQYEFSRDALKEIETTLK